MAQEIKFTPFGIPYITEFENVSFVPRRRPPSLLPSSASSSSSFCYIETPPPPPPPLPSPPLLSFRSAASLFKKRPNQPTWPADSDNTKPLPPPPHADVSETHGIYIQFPPEYLHPQMTRKERLVHLQQTISVAVLDAGMSGSPGNTAHPEKHPDEDATRRARGYKTQNALFCGTYGQLMTAIEGAGLSAISCVGEGLSGHTRLGALFVARNDGTSGVQLRKITLWG